YVRGALPACDRAPSQRPGQGPAALDSRRPDRGQHELRAARVHQGQGEARRVRRLRSRDRSLRCAPSGEAGLALGAPLLQSRKAGAQPDTRRASRTAVHADQTPALRRNRGRTPRRTAATPASQTRENIHQVASRDDNRRRGQTASLRLAFWIEGAAAFALASGRALTVTDAGLAAIVISSPVAGFRPGRAFVAARTRTSSCTTAPILTFSAAESCSSTT